MEIMIVFISFYKLNDNLLYLIFYGYFYSIFHVCHKIGTFGRTILFHAILKIDWAGQPSQFFSQDDTLAWE